MIKHLLQIALYSSIVSAHAQDSTTASDTARLFTLGMVTVHASSRAAFSTVKAARLERFARNTVSQALNLLPGVTLSNVGPRNEAMVYVRGFDLRHVPILIDGIPAYVPYDGYADLARFTTFDIASIQISRQYTSVNYGPNAMGGAINLVTRKPVHKLELDGASGWISGGLRSNFNIGSRLGKFFMQAGLSKYKRNHYPMSSGFIPTAHEDGHDRDNSYNDDTKVSIKASYQPNERSTYVISYAYQHGKKGTPVYAGRGSLNSLLWNGRVRGLEHQVDTPMTPVQEMNQAFTRTVAKLQAKKIYPPQFRAAFGDDRITKDRIEKAIAQFERTLISCHSKYDQYLQGQYTPTATELAGIQLFFGHNTGKHSARRPNCSHCHGGPKTFEELYMNNGLDSMYKDRGRAAITHAAEDQGRFKAVTLRNIVLTAPYLHDGRFATLGEVINHYSQYIVLSKELSPVLSAAFSGSGQLPPFSAEGKTALSAFFADADRFQFYHRSPVFLSLSVTPSFTTKNNIP